jgi:hypothetical protein
MFVSIRRIKRERIDFLKQELSVCKLCLVPSGWYAWEVSEKFVTWNVFLE